jgi:hypothetical protein
MYNLARIVPKMGALRLIRNFLIAACLSLLAAGSVCAQEAGPRQLPDAPGVSSQPSPPTARHDAVVFHKKVFWTLVGVDAASAVADAQTSSSNLQNYPNTTETNSWLYGRRPSLGRYYATFAVMDGGSAFLSYKLLHSRRKNFRRAGWGLLAFAAGEHLYYVGINEGPVRYPAPTSHQSAAAASDR